MDFEGNREQMEVSEWHQLVHLQFMGSFSSLIMLIHNFEPTKASNIMCIIYTFLVLGTNYIGTYNFSYVLENLFVVLISVLLQMLAVYIWFCNQNFEKSVMQQMVERVESQS